MLAVLVFASINANMAAKALAHSSYFRQAAVREFLLKTEEKKLAGISKYFPHCSSQLRRKVRREQHKAVLG